MTAFVALLRAVNVAGTGKLPMAELKAMGEACGFRSVTTFIASGNLLFLSDEPEKAVAQKLAGRIETYFGKAVPIFVRTAAEMREAADQNPFADDSPGKVMAHFIDETPTQAMLDAATGRDGERLALGPRLIYVSYGDGMGSTKLKLPAVRGGTARNMNTVAKLAALAALAAELA
jgi:uncharacterized protein (DUF1697 family)